MSAFKLYRDAVSLHSKKKIKEAEALYQKVISDYPDSIYSEQSHTDLLNINNRVIVNKTKILTSKLFRLMIGVLLPVFSLPLFLILIALISLVFSENNLKNAPWIILGISFYSIFFMFIPALIYSFIMEYIINPYINNSYLGFS